MFVDTPYNYFRYLCPQSIIPMTMDKKKTSKPYGGQPSANPQAQYAKEPMMEYQARKCQLPQSVKESIDISLAQIERGEAVDAEIVIVEGYMASVS